MDTDSLKWQLRVHRDDARATLDERMEGRRAEATRLASLDALRGVAILLVLFHHPVVPFAWAGVLAPIAHVTYRIGWTGVDLFFVLSGFLVGGLLLHELHDYRRVDIRRFLTRRAFKIWPSYFLLIACVFVQMSTWDPPYDAAKAFKHILPNLFHVQNYWLSPRLQTWSLAVEEHFYLVLPFVVALVARSGRPGTWLGLIAITLMVGCFALRCRGVSLGIDSPIPFVFSTQYRLDGLFFGVLLAYLYHYDPERLRALAPWRLVLVLVGLAFVSPMAFIDLHFSPFVVTAGFTLLYLGYGLLMLAALIPTLEPNASVTVPGRTVSLLAGVGRVSYPMYLWFFDVQATLARLGLPALCPGRLVSLTGNESVAHAVWWLSAQSIYIAATVAAGYVMTAIIERPGLALRDRLFPPRASALG